MIQDYTAAVLLVINKMTDDLARKMYTSSEETTRMWRLSIQAKFDRLPGPKSQEALDSRMRVLVEQYKIIIDGTVAKVRLGRSEDKEAFIKSMIIAEKILKTSKVPMSVLAFWVDFEDSMNRALSSVKRVCRELLQEAHRSNRYFLEEMDLIPLEEVRVMSLP